MKTYAKDNAGGAGFKKKKKGKKDSFSLTFVTKERWMWTVRP